MHHQLRRGSAALAFPAMLVVILLGPAAARADGAASVAISNVRLGVLDLTPDDGAHAGFDLVSLIPSLYASIAAGSADYYSSGYPGPYMPADIALGFADTASGAATDGTLGSVSSHAGGTAALGDYGYAAASGVQEIHLTLRPYSVLTIGGHLSALAQRHGAVQDYDVVGLASVSIVDAHGDTYTQLARQSLSYADWPDRMEIDEDFMLAFANGSAREQDVSLYLQAWSNVTRIATPVPEPSMPAMLAAGAGLLAALRRRRRAEAAPRPMLLPMPMPMPMVPPRLTRSQSRSNTAIDSTCDVCGNMLTTPAWRSV